MSEIALKYKNPTYSSMNSHGLLEIRDLVTDELIFYQRSLNDDVMSRTDVVKIKTSDGAEVLCERGLESAAAPSKGGRWEYSDNMTELIVDQIANGECLTDLPEGFPKYSTIWRWRKQFPEFDEALIMAMRMKSDRFLQQIETENYDLDAVDDKLELEVKKAKIDNMKWLAEKHDPSRFGRTKEKNQTGALQIIVNTGIIRDEDTFIEVVKEK